MKNILIQLELKGEEAERFLLVKQIKGLRRNTEVLRVLVAEEFQRLQNQGVLVK